MYLLFICFVTGLIESHLKLEVTTAY